MDPSVILALLVVTAAAQDAAVSINIDSPSLPVHYKGEIAKITCSFNLAGTPTQSGVKEFGLFTNSTDNDVGSSIAACRKVDAMTGVEWNDKVDGDGIEGVTASTCATAAQAIIDTGVTSLEISLPINAVANYYCFAWSGPVSASERLPIESLDVAPSNLKMTLSSPSAEVHTETTITFECQSEGGEPASNFVYGVGDEELSVGELVVTKEYNGQMVWCRDVSHPNYLKGDNPATYQEKELSVYYLEVNMAERNLTVNPKVSERLSCDTESNLPVNVTLMYKWYTDGEEVKDATQMTYTVSPKENVTEVSYECKAYTADSIMEKTSTFNIKYDIRQTPPVTTPTTTTKADKVDKKPIEEPKKDYTVVIVVVAVVVAVIVVVVIIIIVLKRRKAAGQMEADGKQNSQKAKDAEAARDEEANVTEEKTPLTEQDDSKESDAPQPQANSDE